MNEIDEIARATKEVAKGVNATGLPTLLNSLVMKPVVLRAQRMNALSESKLRDDLITYAQGHMDKLHPSASAETKEKLATVFVAEQLLGDQGRQNIADIMERAWEEVGDEEVDPNGPSVDWWHRLYDCGKFVSNEDLQVLFAKVVAGEMKRPGSIAYSTLEVLRRLDPESARIFRIWRSMSVSDDRSLNLCTLGYRTNQLEDYGLSLGDFARLQEVGLIDHLSTEIGLMWGLSATFQEPDADITMSKLFQYLNKRWVVYRLDPLNTKIQDMKIVPATRAGVEIGHVVPPVENPRYTLAFKNCLERYGLQMDFASKFKFA